MFSSSTAKLQHRSVFRLIERKIKLVRQQFTRLILAYKKQRFDSILELLRTVKSSKIRQQRKQQLRGFSLSALSPNRLVGCYVHSTIYQWRSLQLDSVKSSQLNRTSAVGGSCRYRERDPFFVTLKQHPDQRFVGRKRNRPIEIVEPTFEPGSFVCHRIGQTN